MRIFPSLLLCFLVFTGNAQSALADSLVSEGIKLYRKGEQMAAVQRYQSALKIDKHNGRALYELAYAAFERGDFREAIRYTTKIRRHRGATLLRAYQLEGSAYDELNQHKKAIKRFRQGLARYPDNYLLHYNLALTYFQTERFPEAITHLEAALTANPTHASSHYMLGYIWTAYQNQIPAIQALQFFLLLEPDSPRSKQALDLIAEALDKMSTAPRPQVTPDGKNLLAAADHLVALTFRQLPPSPADPGIATRLLTLDATSADLFSGAMAKAPDTFFWTFYADFLVSVAEAGHLEALTHFVSQQRGGVSYFYLEGNPDKIRALFDWLASVE